jgi:hypothetical protein
MCRMPNAISQFTAIFEYKNKTTVNKGSISCPPHCNMIQIHLTLCDKILNDSYKHMFNRIVSLVDIIYMQVSQYMYL